MKKQFEVAANNGVLTYCEIKISLNSNKIKKTFHNRSTHDEEERLVSVHKVEAFKNGYLFKVVNDILSLDEVEKEAERLEKELRNTASGSYQNTQIKNFEKRLFEKGFE